MLIIAVRQKKTQKKDKALTAEAFFNSRWMGWMACRCIQQLGVGSCNAASILSGQNVVASQMEVHSGRNSIQFFRLDSIICGSALAGPPGEYTGASNKRGPHEGPFRRRIHDGRWRWRCCWLPGAFRFGQYHYHYHRVYTFSSLIVQCK